MQRNNNSIMIFEIIRGGKLTGWGKNEPAYFFPGERMGRPILSPGKKLTGGKFRPVTPGHCPMISKYGPSLTKTVGPVDPSFLVVKKSEFNKKIFILQQVYELHKTERTCRLSIQ